MKNWRVFSIAIFFVFSVAWYSVLVIVDASNSGNTVEGHQKHTEEEDQTEV